MKIVINKCFGGFGLSPKAVKRYAELKGIEVFIYKQKYDEAPVEISEAECLDKSVFCHYTTKRISTEKELNKNYFSYYDISRTDPCLIQTVEELGEEADGDFANLSVIEIPDGINYKISEYDGQESVEESHRSWS